MDDKHGVLLAVSSLPSRHGIGDFGKSCYEFINWLVKNGYKYWQVLPLNPLGPGYSPYMSTCSNALEYRYVSLDLLIKNKLLKKVPDFQKKSIAVDFYNVGNFKKKYLWKAYQNYLKGNTSKFNAFKKAESWLKYYGTFEVLKRYNDNKCWNEWCEEDKLYFDRHTEIPSQYKDEIDFEMWIQFIALKQWMKVLSYARKKGIKVICDMPFYVGFDGIECWLNKDQFSIGADCKLFEVGGVGPDAFSDLGQLWGTPIYNFERMAKDNYSLLVDRVGYLLKICDYLRIDHFRAFDTYYVIPGNATDARLGEWKLGPGTKFFDALYAKYPNANLIAEDLGDLRPEVLELRDHYNLPGMFISEFTIFDLKNESTNKQLVYPGTHDNETLYGWYKNRKPEELQFIMERLKVTNINKLYDAIFDYIWNIPSLMTIFQMQDLLKLDNRARMNYPGTVGEPNWMWKLKDFSWMKTICYPKGK